MKLLLINPKFDESFWSFKFAIDNIFVKEKAINPPLGLATVAALTPSNWQVNIIDENIQFEEDIKKAGGGQPEESCVSAPSPVRF